MQIPFGEWLPDQPAHGMKGADVATNVYHALGSYKRFPSLVSYSSNSILKMLKVQDHLEIMLITFLIS